MYRLGGRMSGLRQIIQVARGLLIGRKGIRLCALGACLWSVLFRNPFLPPYRQYKVNNTTFRRVIDTFTVRRAMTVPAS